ncbi:MAG TPA: AAA family ATPase [Candidatus Cybelea sp.]|jgi:DNA-binding CsgD family transcriptional regulator/tetratricopeptide (TPR) repeat protein
MSRPPHPDAVLFGRERELRVIEERLDTVNDSGNALLVRGEPGVGKTAILEAARSRAALRDMSVLAATGVPSETNLPFAGLYELLRPIVERTERLPGPQQDALRAAFGLADVAAAELFLVALGALDLLSDFASECALLLVVDDAQWLDRSTVNVLTFIARRLQSEPIALLVASRDLSEAPFAGIMPELRVEGLNEIASRELLRTHSPNLSGEIRDRVLRESAGNPLALVELPKAVALEASSIGLLPAHLPLTTRLERAFASRISELPLRTRQTLLIAATDDESNLVEILSAAKLLGGEELSLDVLAPAVTAGLIYGDAVNVRFRHPLVRSAMSAASNIAERAAAHMALATVLKVDPERSIWHRAAATVGSDDAVAQALETTGTRALQRGDVRVAIAAFDRAAELGADTAMRARCLLKAAELAFEIGWNGLVVSLLQKAETLELSRRDRAWLTWYREAAQRSISGAEALREIANSIKTDDDVDLALDLLSGPATKGWWAEPDEDVCKQVIGAVERARISSGDDPRFVLIVAMTAPIDRGAFVIERLRHFAANVRDDARTAHLLGVAAIQIGDFDLAERFLSSAIAGFRSDGRLALLAQMLVLRAWSAIFRGNRNVAMADAEEGAHLAHETEQPAYVSLAQAATAISAGMRGDYESAEGLANDAERVAQPLGILFAEVQMARGITALSAARYDDAYRHLRRMFDPRDSAYHPMRHCYFIGDLAEAAVQSGHRDDAVALLAETETLGRRTPSPQFQLALRYARAILADDTEAPPLFKAALAGATGQSPFTMARLRLAFGTWLRRARHVKEARPLLQAAMEAFDSLGALPWSERARQELRAAGATIARRVPARQEELTAQELQIALMAAQGLTNREIGQRLYLSHRTVGSHLYRIYPKLDITSRFQLRDALATERAMQLSSS